MSETLVKLSGLTKVFRNEAEELLILDNINASFLEGEKIAITGQSGSGKSTLLNIIGGLDSFTAGSIVVSGKALEKMNDSDLNNYRGRFIGFIFQFHYLLKDFTALENVYLPGYMAGMSKHEAMERAKTLICEIELENRFHHFPAQLSGGERQRLAMARALMNNPQLILADEPTGNLDEKNAAVVEDILFRLVDIYKKTLILVTHDSLLASRADIIYELHSKGLTVK